MMAIHAKAGFSLVEVALALLVIAIGMTAALGLFPEATKMVRESTNDVEVGLFADYVFSTLDMVCQMDSLEENTWSQQTSFSGILDRANEVLERDKYNKMFRSTAIDEEKDLTVFLKGTGAGEVHEFFWVPQWYGIGNDGDYAGSEFAHYWTTAFTYSLDFRVLGNREPARVILTVWPGAGGTDNTNSIPYVFVRELLGIR